LVNLEILQKAKITGQQINEQIVFKLWELGLVPETTFSIQRKESDFLEIQQGEKQVKLPIELAKQVNIIV
jgi:Fe2+ transport system protein FeoA